MNGKSYCCTRVQVQVLEYVVYYRIFYPTVPSSSVVSCVVTSYTPQFSTDTVTDKEQTAVANHRDDDDSSY